MRVVTLKGKIMKFINFKKDKILIRLDTIVGVYYELGDSHTAECVIIDTCSDGESDYYDITQYKYNEVVSAIELALVSPKMIINVGE